MDKIFVVYHKDDNDGMISGALIKYMIINGIYSKIKVKSNSIVMMPESYDSIDADIDKIPDGSIVIMADICIQPTDKMIKLHNRCDLIWIDHHKNVIKELSGNHISGLRRITNSACELTLEFFNDRGIYVDRRIVELLGQYDSFRGEKLNNWIDILRFEYGFRSLDIDPVENFKFLNGLFDMMFGNTIKNSISVDDFIKMVTKDGIPILRYLDRSITKNAINKGFNAMFDGIMAFCLNQSCNSYFFDKFIDKNFHQMGMTFMFNGKINKYNISLYSKVIDVSVIAKKFGGGGHPGASGFSCSAINFVPMKVGDKIVMNINVGGYNK